MKTKFVIILFTLSVVAKCNLMAAVARPVLLSFGTIFAAMHQDAIDIQPINWRNLMPFTSKNPNPTENSEPEYEPELSSKTDKNY